MSTVLALPLALLSRLLITMGMFPESLGVDFYTDWTQKDISLTFVSALLLPL